MDSPRYSIIIPVYNRPQEIDELLQSLTLLTIKNFEVIVVEDGSSIRCDDVIEKYNSQLNIQYFYKKNSGPGPTRNYGFERAKGDYFIVFDSDCIIPPTYLQAVEESLAKHHWDAWGGPDRAHENFTTVQRAMGYTMSSVLTTGGIRGAKKSVGRFQPRSFNMAISRHVFDVTHGFTFDRFAEDIELSVRMMELGFKVGLIHDAYVYHKRRTNFRQFFKQVSNFGRGRVLVGLAHPTEVKLTHWFPSVFTMATVALILSPLISVTLFKLGVFVLALYLAMILAHAFITTKNFFVSILSVPSALFQLWGYGIGFLQEWIKSYVKKMPKNQWNRH